MIIGGDDLGYFWDKVWKFVYLIIVMVCFDYLCFLKV